jgi:Insertion element 4 transposase N-terminal
VREILEEANRASVRQRDLPAQVVIYYVIALALYMRSSYREVLRCLLEGVQWLLDPSGKVKVAGQSSISPARSRLGVEPVQKLYEAVVVPTAQKRTQGAWYRQWRLVSLDGSTMDVADTAENEKAFGRPGASGDIYIGGSTDNVVYKISGGMLSIVAGTPGSSGYSGDGGQATSALLNDPQGVAVDSAGNLYIVDYLNYVVREVSGGIIKTIAGNGSYGRPVPGPATATPMFDSIGVAVDARGNVYISVGQEGGFILKVANGTLSIVAGVGYEGTVTSGASATMQPVVAPHFITVDPSGNVIVPTSSAGQVLKLTTSNGTISVLAGSGTSGPLGGGGPATSASMTPFGAAVDSSGNLYIADTANARVREVVNGIINTIAGNGNGTCYNGYSGPATGVNFNNPAALVVVGSTIYIADASCVYKLTGASTTGPPSISAGGVVSAIAYGEFSAVAPGSYMEIYGANLASTARPWAASDFTGPNAPTQLSGTSVTMGGQSAFVSYISPTQVNAQVPSNVTPGPQQVVVNFSLGQFRAIHHYGECGGTGAARAGGLVYQGKPIRGGILREFLDIRAAGGYDRRCDVPARGTGPDDRALWPRIWFGDAEHSRRTMQNGM